MDSLLTVPDLAQILRKSIHSVRHDVNRNPTALPPLCLLPGTRRLLWRLADVEVWINAHVVAPAPTVPAAQLRADQPRRRRGRPTKAESLARQGLIRDPKTIDFIAGKTDAERGSK